MPFGGAIVNRFHLPLPGVNGAGEDGSAIRAALDAPLGARLAAKAVETLEEWSALAARDAAGLERLGQALGAGAQIIEVPEFDEDVHDVAGLLEVQSWLFAEEHLEVGR